MSWTEEKVQKLKELWGKGNTASQIAEIIGGISRNAVIGKANRLGLSKKLKEKEVKKDSKEITVNGLIASMKGCKWPIGHPDESSFYFCGRSSLKDFSYCKLHILYAYQPKGKKDDVIEKEEDVVVIGKKIQSA